MFEFQDFWPGRGQMEHAVIMANQWIEKNGIQVINVETLKGDKDTWAPGKARGSSDDGVRVWYSVATNKRLQEILDTQIENLDLSARPLTCLRSISVFTVGDLAGKTISDLRNIPGLGLRSLNEIIDAMALYGIKL